MLGVHPPPSKSSGMEPGGPPNGFLAPPSDLGAERGGCSLPPPGGLRRDLRGRDSQAEKDQKQPPRRETAWNCERSHYGHIPMSESSGNVTRRDGLRATRQAACPHQTRLYDNRTGRPLPTLVSSPDTAPGNGDKILDRSGNSDGAPKTAWPPPQKRRASITKGLSFVQSIGDGSHCFTRPAGLESGVPHS
jgi:hypothetical protein